MLKLAKQQMYKKCIIVFLSLLIVCNLVHWKVLCFGADGHIELESAFHKCCEDPDHSSAPDQNEFSYKAGHETCKHCGPCVDMPITNDLVQISNTPQKIITKISLPTTYMFIDTDKLNSYVYNLVSNSFIDPARGNLHLKSTVAEAVDKGLARTEVVEDIDGERRGAKPDIGADELAN